MPKFIPVDHDPFPGIEFVPVDHDPFAVPVPNVQAPDAATSDKDQQISYNKLDCLAAYYACLSLRGGAFRGQKTCSQAKQTCEDGTTTIFAPGIVGGPN